MHTHPNTCFETYYIVGNLYTYICRNVAVFFLSKTYLLFLLFCLYLFFFFLIAMTTIHHRAAERRDLPHVQRDICTAVSVVTSNVSNGPTPQIICWSAEKACPHIYTVDNSNKAAGKGQFLHLFLSILHKGQLFSSQPHTLPTSSPHVYNIDLPWYNPSLND